MPADFFRRFLRVFSNVYGFLESLRMFWVFAHQNHSLLLAVFDGQVS